MVSCTLRPRPFEKLDDLDAGLFDALDSSGKVIATGVLIVDVDTSVKQPTSGVRFFVTAPIKGA